MNYFYEIKSFYDRLELNPAPASAIALWHAIAYIANKVDKSEFTVASSTLMLKSGLSESSFKRARNYLSQNGYITWKSRPGNQSAVYALKQFAVQYGLQSEPQSEPQSGLQSEPQTDPQSEPINKLKHKPKQKQSITMCKNADTEEFFESIWKLYPNKKGKGQVSDATKLRLYSVGLDEMKRAIERYIDDLKKEEWRKPQNGSTFFNSGYVDYLDANYEPLTEVPKVSRNQFNNYSGSADMGVVSEFEKLFEEEGKCT